MVWDGVYEIWGAKLGEKRGNDIREQDNAFGNIGPYQIKGGGEDDHIEDVVDQTYDYC